MISENAAIQALGMLSAIPYFPQDPAAKAAVLEALERFVDSDEKLLWLGRTAMNHMRSWQGLSELRGMFCTRWKPADGIEENCSVTGFTATDIEAGNSSPSLPSGSPEARQRLLLASAKPPRELEDARRVNAMESAATFADALF